MKSHVVIFLKGFLMGACDVVPGVSGGTIAFITGIYERLLDAIHKCDMTALRFFFSLQWKKLRTYVDGGFLVSLLGGILVAIITLAKMIEYTLQAHPIAIRSLFLGLLLASIWVVARTVQGWNTKLFAWLILGGVFGWFATTLPVLHVQPSMLSTFFAGMIAIMAMVLPGISGSYLLLIANHYQHIISTLVAVIDGVKESLILFTDGLWQGAWDHLWTLPWATLMVFIAGALVGVIAFVKILHRIKDHYHDQLIAVLIGIMIGALNKVRPRKSTVSTYIDRHGEVKPLLEKNILPDSFEGLVRGFVFILVGLSMVLAIDYRSRNKKIH